MKDAGDLFLRNFIFDLDEIKYAATTCWFVEAHAKFMLWSNIQGREVCWCDFIKYMINQGCRFSIIFRYFWPDLFSTCKLIFSIFSYFIFLFLSLFVFIFCEMARTRRFSVIFAKVQWHPWLTLSCARTLVSQFVSNLVWRWTGLNSTRSFQFEWPWCSLKVTGSQES